MEYQLPQNAILSGWADRELGKMHGAGAVLAAFKGYAEGTHLPRQYAPYPIGKNKMLHEVRETDAGQEVRLIFGKVRPRRVLPTGSSQRARGRGGKPLPVLSAGGGSPPPLDAPIRLVGLLATEKDQRRLRRAGGNAAWDRLQLWLEAHELYELDGSG